MTVSMNMIQLKIYVLWEYFTFLGNRIHYNKIKQHKIFYKKELSFVCVAIECLGN